MTGKNLRIDRVPSPLFETIDVAAVFIDELLPTLSSDAIKLYLVLLRAASRGDILSADGLATRLSLTAAEVEAGLDALKANDLLTDDATGNCRLTDPRDLVLQRNYRRTTASSPEEIAQNAERDQRLQDLLKQINDTYFSGMMSPSWYADIDRYIADYHFSPEVVYSLFSQCERRNSLNRNYVRRVAEDWNRRGIITFEDLDRATEAWQKEKDIAFKIGAKLRRKMTEYDEEEVRRWVNDYGYDFPIIEEAMTRTTAISNPNLRYIGGILDSWHKTGLKTVDEIRIWEASRQTAARAARTARGRQQSTSDPSQRANRSTGRSDNVGNFKEREYSDEFLNDLVYKIEDLGKDEQL